MNQECCVFYEQYSSGALNLICHRNGPEQEAKQGSKSQWQLELGGSESYPQWSDEADCIYYLRTGYCGYDSDVGSIIPETVAWRGLYFC
ncbi:hypothetical protein K1719_003498 [Acacia pycnantha]|nr:hypothetical protein K1719_003498 [Acacia pycnantha]